MNNGSAEAPKEPPPGEAPDAEFRKEFERTVRSYAKAVEGDKTAEALESAFKLLMLAAEEAEAHPKPEQLLLHEAEEALRAGDWAGAERIYRKALALKEPFGGFAFFHIIKLSLSRMLQLIGRLDDAWTAACSATEAARKADLYSLVTKALQNEARCALQRGDPEKALRAAAKALKVLDPGKIADMCRADAWILRAECLVATGQITAAEADLERSWEILLKWGGGPLPPRRRLASWFEVKASIAVAHGAFAEAGAALNRAIKHYRGILDLPWLSSPYAFAALAKALESLAKVRLKQGKRKLAEKARKEARTIWKRLRLPEKALR